MTRSSALGAIVIASVVVLGFGGALITSGDLPFGDVPGVDLPFGAGPFEHLGLLGSHATSDGDTAPGAGPDDAGDVARLQQRSGPPVQSHAYNAVSVMEAGPAVELPLWRNRHTAARHTTAIAVMNVSGKPVDVTITFRDASGQPITDCGADCTATIAPLSAVYWWPPELKGVGERTDMSGSATIESTDAVAAVVVDMSQTGKDDMASYRGIGLESEYPSSSENLHPQLLRNALDVGGETGSSMLQVLNVDPRIATDVTTSFYPWAGGAPIALALKIEPRESGIISLGLSPELSDGPYSAIAVADQAVIGSLSRSDWAESGAAVMARESAPGAVSIVPIVFKNAGDRCSLVTIQNPSRRAEVEYDVEIYEPGSSKPVMTRTKLVNPGRAALLDLCRGNEFADLADDFVGAMRVVAPDSALVASHALVDVSSAPGPAAAAGLPGSLAAENLYAPLIHSVWPPDRANPDMPDLSSMIAVNNPGTEPVEVAVTYAGVRGGCAGQTFSHDPRTIPPLTSEFFDPGPDGADVLPAPCIAAAHIEATGGDVLAFVFDQGYPKQPTPTPTRPPTDTPTSVPTSTATLTPTLVASPSVTATTRATETPTDTASPIATTVEPTVEPTGRATNTSTPPPPTAPRETPLPPATNVPARVWTRVDSSNSLLPYDNVRFLEIDNAGGTWMRLIKPAGGPDAVVYVEPTGKWRVYDAGIKAVIDRQPREFLLGLRALRDFFDVDERGRLWVGPEVHDGTGWDAVARDVGSPAGGVRYDDRTLVDPAQQAWVPYSTQLDCVPPQPCIADGVRAFGPGGDLAEDVRVRPSSGGPRYGIPDVQLISRRGRVPGGVVVSSDGGHGGARGGAHGGAQDGAQDRTGDEVGAVAGRGARPDSPAQATGDTEWIVAAGEYFVLPGSEALYYPFLDPSDWLSTGLRNAGFASTATVSPDGQLQVITWLERDTGTTVEYQILLNTLADTGWLVEDLTNKGPLGTDVEFETIVAMDYCPDGALWLATAAGAIGVRADGDRPDGAWTVYPEGSGVIEDGAVVSDIGCGPEGTVWIGTQSGLLGYGFERPPVEIYAPSTEK